MGSRRSTNWIWAATALGLAALSIFMLEQQRVDVTVERAYVGPTPVTIWQPEISTPGPLVLVAHGYAGSRQMMQPISIALARAGFTVAAFDFYGHGRNPVPMNADITSLDGATAQLVAQTVAVADALLARPDMSGPVSLVGHSMATDIVIRAATQIEDTVAVVAISMYSDAVTPQSPERLLIVSGAQEGRLREVALDRLQQLDPDATEGQTVLQDGVTRRAVAAPWVGHVGVLYSATTLDEVRDWIAEATGRTVTGPLPRIGVWLLALLGSLVALVRPVAAALEPVVDRATLSGRRAILIVLTPIIPALVAAIAFPFDVFGFVAFAPLAAFFGVWGAIQLALLWPRRGPFGLRPLAALVLLIWGLCVFAPALDHYGAAFVPTGPRLSLMLVMILGTIPFCVADSILIARCRWFVGLAVRLLPLVALFIAMLIAPQLGAAFTVLPVMILFWVVYGLAARWLRPRGDPWSVGIALGIVLGWSIAASTPVIGT